MEEKDINKIEAEQDVKPTDETLSEPTAEVSEKDSTVELREAYEEKRAEQPPQKKKKMSKKKLTLIIVASVVVALLVAVGLFLLISRLLAQKYTIVTVDASNTPPAVAVSYSTEELALINSAMAEDATDDVIKQAIAMMYAKANSNKINNTEQAITILQGKGSANAFGAIGSMVVRGFKVQSGTEFYYQKAAPIVECDPIEVQISLEKLLNQQERVYTNGTDIFRYTGTLKGTKSKIRLDENTNPMTATVPFIPVDVPNKNEIKSAPDKATFYENGYYLQDPREITNFNIEADYVVLNDDWDDESSRAEGEKKPDTIKRIERQMTQSGDYYYVCRFSLLIAGENREGCVGTARRYLRDSAGSTDLEYLRFDVRLEVWENGFFKMMHDEEIWKGTAKGVETESRSWYESLTYYDFNADLFTAEDAAEYEGEDWAANIIAHYKAELDNAKK
ncbi:MAG: hypothetical protein IJT69_03105 [Clostridia bacterium]|nr:hypothetical protein [Clostridia bacterium]